jgi:hypothetical protein
MKTTKDVTSISQHVTQNLNLHGLVLNQTSFLSSQAALGSLDTQNDMFGDEEE